MNERVMSADDWKMIAEGEAEMRKQAEAQCDDLRQRLRVAERERDDVVDRVRALQDLATDVVALAPLFEVTGAWDAKEHAVVIIADKARSLVGQKL